jgi:hypothetical protein
MYSCCAQVCVRTLESKHCYLVSVIIDTSTPVHKLVGNLSSISTVGIPANLYMPIVLAHRDRF